jgi:hypothetical protein
VASARNVRATEHGNRGKIETVEGFARGQAGLKQMSLDASLIAFGELQFGERGEQSCRRPPFAIGPLGEALPHGGDGRQPQFTQQQRQPRGVDFDRVAGAVVHAASPRDGRSRS